MLLPVIVSLEGQQSVPIQPSYIRSKVLPYDQHSAGFPPAIESLLHQGTSGAFDSFPIDLAAWTKSATLPTHPTSSLPRCRRLRIRLNFPLPTG
jgi:hypothetical protein